MKPSKPIIMKINSDMYEAFAAIKGRKAHKFKKGTIVEVFMHSDKGIPLVTYAVPVHGPSGTLIAVNNEDLQPLTPAEQVLYGKTKN